MIVYQLTRDVSTSTQITYNNMRTYYEYYAVDWALPTIVEQITGIFCLMVTSLVLFA